MIINGLEEWSEEHGTKKKVKQALKEVGIISSCLRKPSVEKLKPGAFEKLVKKSTTVCKKHSHLLDED